LRGFSVRPRKEAAKWRPQSLRFVLLRRSAAWATRLLLPASTGSGSKTPTFAARPAFLSQWVTVIKPRVFVHRADPGRMLTVDDFNALVRPFSDVKDTAELLRQNAAIQVDGVAYEPGADAGTTVVDGRFHINTWTPSLIGRRQGDAKRFLDFMALLIPITKDRDNTLKWCATLIACPKVRMRYGLLLISEIQGVGKGTLMEKILAPLAGWQNTSVPSEKMLIDSDFNSWIAHKRLVLVHEIYAGHSKKPYNSVKSGVTDDKIEVNEKYVVSYKVNNWSHFILASNSFKALGLVKADRRWFVPGVTENKQAPEYWTKLNTWLVDGGLEIIHQWAYDYINEHGAVTTADEAPESAAKEKIIRASRSEGQQFVFDLAVAAADNEDNAIVLVDRAVRDWLRIMLGIDSSDRMVDRKVESLATVRAQLREGGMKEMGERIVKGKRHVWFANQKTIDTVFEARTRAENADVFGDWKWDEFKAYEVANAENVIPNDDADVGAAGAGAGDSGSADAGDDDGGPDDAADDAVAAARAAGYR